MGEIYEIDDENSNLHTNLLPNSMQGDEKSTEQNAPMHVDRIIKQTRSTVMDDYVKWLENC